MEWLGLKISWVVKTIHSNSGWEYSNSTERVCQNEKFEMNAPSLQISSRIRQEEMFFHSVHTFHNHEKRKALHLRCIPGTESVQSSFNAA